MITLITGTPGSGKTLYAVWCMLRELKAGRRLVVDGIRDLAIDHELVDEPWVRDWHNRCQPQDVIIIDEVQRIWPPQSVSVKPTEDIEKLHVHRHMGVDFVIITQHPQRLHKTIRDLVGRHVHVRRLFGMKRAMIYEWDHCHNPNAGFRDAVKTSWAYPKKVFELYTSAEVHTKPKAVIPKALYVIPVALAVALFFGWKGLRDFGVTGLGGKKKPETEAVKPDAADPVKGAPSKMWRVAGRFALDGQGYVVVADENGRFRTMKNDHFVGTGLGLEGPVDGDKAAVWTGKLAAAAVEDKKVEAAK